MKNRTNSMNLSNRDTKVYTTDSSKNCSPPTIVKAPAINTSDALNNKKNLCSLSVYGGSIEIQLKTLTRRKLNLNVH